MTRRQTGSRDAGIERRTRARNIAILRSRQRMAALPDSRRVSRVTWLKQLASTVQANGFTERERLDAEAALLQGNPTAPQFMLPFKETRSA